LGILALAASGLHLLFETRGSLEWVQWLAIVGIGVLSLNLSNSFWDKAIRTGHTATISSIAYLTPLVSLLLLAALGIGTVTVAAAAGGVLVVSGALIASFPTLASWE
jgi:drug/metabolite transporter (DMT)-like permease